MKPHEKEVLQRVENLITDFQAHVRNAESEKNKKEEDTLVYGLRMIVALANMIINHEPIFTIEPWHSVSNDPPLAAPGEMLLRARDYKGVALEPYPAIMAFYKTDYTPRIDTVLFLAALNQFAESDEKQASINISARSLRDADFVKATAGRIEELELPSDRQVIIEIHESAPHLAMSRQVLEIYQALDVRFAIDDVGLNLNDVMRLAEFEGLAQFVKIDRHAVCAPPGAPNTLDKVMPFVRTLMPGVTAVAEGVRDAKHALEIRRQFPDIHYVQGMHLSPNRRIFAKSLADVQAQEAGGAKQA